MIDLYYWLTANGPRVTMFSDEVHISPSIIDSAPGDAVWRDEAFSQDQVLTAESHNVLFGQTAQLSGS